MLEESFDKVQQEEERVRKKKLDGIRAAKRPIDINKLNEFALKHDQFILQMQYKKATSDVGNKSMVSAPTSYTPKYRSKFYQRNLEQEQTRREMEEAKKELKQLLFEKKKSYSRYVGDVHRPNPSQIKSKELENLRDRLHHPIRESVRVSPGTSLPLLPPVDRDRSFQ